MEALFGGILDLSNILLGSYIKKRFGLSETTSRNIALILILAVIAGAAFAAWFAYLAQHD